MRVKFRVSEDVDLTWYGHCDDISKYVRISIVVRGSKKLTMLDTREFIDEAL